jgi:uroporphyrinogen decarboxylase
LAQTNDLFLRALARQPVERTPVWLMRQAGRYLPEYNATRKKAGNFLALCKTPELACEVTLQPIDRYGLDAAILFSDILTIPDAFGLGLHFVEGEGPRFHRKIESEADLAAMPNVDMAEALSYVGDAVALIRKTLDGRVPLIGFSGSPWTLACYMLAGGSSSDDFLSVRKWVYSRPDLVQALLKRLTHAVTDYCDMQVRAGAQAIMLFDSWGGLLADQSFDAFSLQALETIVRDLRVRHPETPVIVFVKGGGQWMERIAATGCQGVGLDWTANLGQARRLIGDRCALQGNLDPAVLLGTPAHIEAEATKVVNSFGRLSAGAGHIFNLGHGISQFTPIDHVTCLVEAVAKASRQQAA